MSTSGWKTVREKKSSQYFTCLESLGWKFTQNTFDYFSLLSDKSLTSEDDERNSGSEEESSEEEEENEETESDVCSI